MPLPPAPISRVNSRGAPQAFKSLDATASVGPGLEFNLLEAFGLFTVQLDGAAVVRLEGSLTGQDWVAFTPDLTFNAAGIQDLAVPPVTYIRLRLVSSAGAVTAWVAATGAAVSSDISIGTLTVATDSDKVEDAPALNGATGAFMLGVRNDAAATKTSADGDYGQVSVDEAGRVLTKPPPHAFYSELSGHLMAAGETFTGPWREVTNYPAVLAFVFFLANPTSATVEWSSDGVNVDTAAISEPIEIAASSTVGLYVGLGSVSPLSAKYVRLKIVNGASAQFANGAELWLLPAPFTGRFIPLNVSLPDYQAGLLTRSVLAGQVPAGTYSNVQLTAQNDLRVGFHAFHITAFDYTAQVITAGSSVTSAFVDVSDFADLQIGTSSTQLIQGYVEWSLDGTNVNHNNTTPFAGAGDFHVPIGAQYARIRVVNLAAVSTTFNLRVFGNYQATGLFTFPVSAPIDPSFPAALVKAAITGADPQGAYANVPIGGTVTVDSTTTPLAGGATFTGTYVSFAGIMNKAVSITTDQAGTVFFDTSHDGVATDRTVSFPVVGGTPFFAALPRLAAYGRIRYTNGATPQGSFKLQTTLTASALGTMLIRLDSELADASILQNVRSVITGKNPSGNYTNVQTDADGRLLTGSGSEFERILARKLDTGEEMRLDTEPTNTDYYIGVNTDGVSTATASWKVIRIYLSATKNPNRIRFRTGVAWDSRTAGWT